MTRPAIDGPINLAELNIVRNELGHTNIVSLIQNAGPPPPQNRNRAPQVEFAGIDVLNLSLGKLRLLDLKDRQKSGELYIGLRDQVFRNVKSESDLLGVLFLMWLRSGDRLVAQPTARDWTGPVKSLP